MEMLEAGLGPGAQGDPRAAEEVSWAGSWGEAGCLTRAEAQVCGVDVLLMAPDHSCPGRAQQPGLSPPSSPCVPKRAEQLKLSATVSVHFNLFSFQMFSDSLPHTKLCAKNSLRTD